MTISDNLNRIINAKANIKQAIENKGVEVSDTALLDEYPALIDSIEVGGSGEGGGDPYYEYLFNAITNNNIDYQRLFHSYNGTELDVSNLDTSNVINMMNMFDGCGLLASLDVSNFDTSKVTTMFNMFNGCRNLTSLDVSNFVTSKVTSMDSMFYGCNKLISLDLSNFDTSNIKSIEDMFNSCDSLTSLNLSNWVTSNVTSINYTFSGCKALTSLDLSGWDTSNAKSMNNLFKNCQSLESLNLSNWDMTKVTASYSMGNIFTSCNSLHTLRLDNCSYDTIKKLITSTGFPTNAIDGVTRTIYCKEENIGDLVAPTNWVFSFVTEEEPEVPVDPPAGDIPLYEPGEFRGNSEITEVVTMVNESHTDLSYMFESCTNLTSVNTQDWDVSNVTTVDGMFSNTYGMPVTSLDFSTWDTSNMTIMDSMFSYMQSGNLPKIDLSSFNTKKLQQAYSMFLWCTNLQELDIRNFELVHEDGTEAAISSMLEGCISLHTLRLDNCSNATIRKIINESGMPQEQAYIDGEYVTRKIYCKASEKGDLVAPNGWEFVTVE